MENTPPDPFVFLIVDDDEQMRRLFKRALIAAYPGALYEEAADGNEAQTKMLLFKPSLIILDFNMPEPNGLQTCASIRRDPTMDDVKILIVSAEPTMELREKAMNVGADAFLAKPFLQEPFLNLISQLLSKAS